jgi:xanthine dehydrogenase YagR molybdenum-binding subunit
MKDHLITRATGAPLNRLDGVQKVTGAATYAYEYPVDHAKLAVFQSEAIAYRGQFVAAVVAETLEMARQAAPLVVVGYEEQSHDVELRADRTDLYTPQIVNPFYQSDTVSGDVETALAQAPVSLDYVYTTPPERVRVISQYVGGAFGSKVDTHPHVLLAVMAAMVSRRPVKLALTRQQMFALAGYRSPTIQRVQLGAGRDGQLTAIAHDIVEQTATIHEFADPTAVPTRVMYAAPNRRTTHRLARLDVPATAWMRAPGECPGMFALESAMDELAIACGLDPIELRIRNEPAVDPESGRPFSSRNLVACLREGAQHFGWQPRDPTPRLRRAGPWLIGTGVAASSYPALQFPAAAQVSVDQAGNYQVRIDAIDIGTGAWTALTQIAADALSVPPERVQLGLGDTSLPQALWATASTGTASWGWAITSAASALRARLQEEFGGSVPAEGLEATGTFQANPEAQQYAMHAFGAQFAEVRVNVDTGEVRVPRLLGVFAAGRIINPKTARSQLLGGMTWGLSMALHEESVLDRLCYPPGPGSRQGSALLTPAGRLLPCPTRDAVGDLLPEVFSQKERCAHQKRRDNPTNVITDSKMRYN